MKILAEFDVFWNLSNIWKCNKLNEWYVHKMLLDYSKTTVKETQGINSPLLHTMELNGWYTETWEITSIGAILAIWLVHCSKQEMEENVVQSGPVKPCIANYKGLFLSLYKSATMTMENLENSSTLPWYERSKNRQHLYLFYLQ